MTRPLERTVVPGEDSFLTDRDKSYSSPILTIDDLFSDHNIRLHLIMFFSIFIRPFLMLKES